MTGYVVHIERHRATVAADTAVYTPGAPPRLVGYSTKVHPLPHAKALLFGRGMSGIVADVTMQIAMAPQHDTAERLATAMPGFLGRATERYCEAAGIDDIYAFGLIELFLVGWTEAERRMRAWCWGNTSRFWPHEDFAPIGQTLPIPPLPEFALPPRSKGSLDKHLTAIMQAQRAFFAAHPEAGGMIGGEVHAWTLTRDGLSQRVIHRFPDQPADTGYLARLDAGVERIDVTDHLFTASQMREAEKGLSHILSAFPGVRSQAAGEGTALGPFARALTTPILLENYLRAWTGGSGQLALQITDKALRAAGIVPDPPKPEDTLSDIPVVRAFVIRYPSASAQSIQSFYDEYAERKRYYDTWKARAAQGDAEGMERIMQAGGTQIFIKLDNHHKALATQAQIVRNTWANPNMSPSDKRQLIDSAYSQMIGLAQSGLNTMREAEEQQR